MPSIVADAPRVSVVLRAYNQRPFIASAIQSILDQTMRDFELILVDDGSDDGTSGVMDDAARRDGRVRVHHQANGGVSSATNAGLAMARAPYIALFDGDDISAPQRLEKQAAFLDAHPDIGMVGSNMVEIDSSDERIGVVRYPSASDEVYATMIRRTAVGGPAPMMRRSIVESIGGWRSQFDFAEDYDFCLRFNEKAPIANLPDFLIFYRRHPRQATVLHRRRQMGLAAVARAAALWRRAGRPDPITPGVAMDASLAERLPLTDEARDRLRALLAPSPEPIADAPATAPN